jgi:hypothetical protein
VDRTNRWGRVAVILLAIFVFPSRGRSENELAEKNLSVSISLLDGRNFEARLISVGASEVVVEVAGKSEAISNNAISSLRFPVVKEEPVPGVDSGISGSAGSEKRLLELSDGSKLYGRQFTGKGNSWVFESEVFGEVSLQTSSLRSLLLTPLIDEAQKSAWEESLSESGSSDALIVVRATGELVRVGGTIREAKSGQINFDFDDQNLEMPLERLKGMTWFQTAKVSGGPSVEVQLRNRSSLQCKSITLSDTVFAFSIGSGVELKVPVDGVSIIQFAAANIRWVAELPTVETSLQTPVPWEFALVDSKTALLPRFIKHRATNDSKNGTLPAADQNLLFASPGSYIFRVPDGFSTLQATVERPELASYRSELIIEVWQEDEKLFSQVLADTDDSLEVKVNVAPEKKTRLSVSAKGPSNLGTEVQWKQVRVLR